MGYQQTMATRGSSPIREAAVGDLVVYAAGGDCQAWEELIAGFSSLVSSITVAHRLSEADSARVRTMVWSRLAHNLGKIRQPHLVGTWVAAVARDECVRLLTRFTPTAAQPAA